MILNLRDNLELTKLLMEGLNEKFKDSNVLNFSEGLI